MAIASIFLLICGVASAATKPSSDVLDRPIAEFSAIPGLEFTKLCEKIGVPGGMFLFASDDFDDRDKEVKFKNVTARRILDSMIAKHPKYVWRFKDGVLLILPKDGAPELGRLIPAYSTTDGNVRYIPEGLVQGAGLRPHGGDMSGSLHSPKMSLEVHNVKLLDALNGAAKKYVHAVWVISRVPGSDSYQSHMDTW